MKRKIVLSESQIINAIKNIIDEARRNPDTNVDEDFSSFYNRMLSKAPVEDIFISFRGTMNVTDVNPKNIYETPTGFYTYPLMLFDIPKEASEREFRDVFPFAENEKYINFFILKTREGVLTHKTSKRMLDRYANKIMKLYPNDNKVKGLCNSFIEGSYSSDYGGGVFHNTHSFWLLLYDVAEALESGNIQTRVSLICRSIGVNGFIDYGYGYIHEYEETQAVFFKVKNLGDVFIYEKPKINDKEFKNVIQNKEYKVIQNLIDGVKLIKLFDKYATINSNGQMVSRQMFDEFTSFKENGFAEVKLNGKWNLIGLNGKLLSPNQWFDQIYTFKNAVSSGYLREGEFLMVRLDGKYNLIDINGKLLSYNQWFDQIYGFTNGFARVRLDDKYNLISQNGKLLSPKWFDDAYNFHNGFARVVLNDKVNLISQNGKLLSPKWFDDARNSISGGFEVERDGKKHKINIDDKSMVEI